MPAPLCLRAETRYVANETVSYGLLGKIFGLVLALGFGFITGFGSQIPVEMSGYMLIFAVILGGIALIGKKIPAPIRIGFIIVALVFLGGALGGTVYYA